MSQAGAFSAQASQLRAELARLDQDARALVMHPSPSGTAALDSAVKALKSHAGPLITEMQAVCPNS